MVLQRRLEALGEPIDLRTSYAPLFAGFGDPTMRLSRDRVLRASRTPQGPATIELRWSAHARAVEASAWGEGAAYLLDRLPDLLGLEQPAPRFEGAPPRVRELAKRAAGTRAPRTHNLFEALTLIVLQQKVRGRDAARGYGNLVRHLADRAPGPDTELYLPPTAAQLRRLPASALLPLGISSDQGRKLVELGHATRVVAQAGELSPKEAARRLSVVRGLGPWSIQSALLRCLGDPDAVITGDYHLPNTVAYNLAGEPRASEARMLELLAPYDGQRGWIIRYIWAAGQHEARRGPRRQRRRLMRQ